MLIEKEQERIRADVLNMAMLTNIESNYGIMFLLIYFRCYYIIFVGERTNLEESVLGGVLKIMNRKLSEVMRKKAGTYILDTCFHYINILRITLDNFKAQNCGCQQLWGFN